MPDTTITMKQFKRILSLTLVLVLLLSCVYLSPLESEAAASDYIATTYAANLNVKTTKAVNLMEAPSTSATAKYTLPADTMLSVKALHKNTSGTYWYEVLYYNLTLYIDATATTLVDHLTGDVTIADVVSPVSLTYGQGFYIGGTISSTLNELGTITAACYTHGDLTRSPAISASAQASNNSYNLTSSTIDSALYFNKLSAGLYAYVVTAEAISYYINDSGVLSTSTKTVVLENQDCVVTYYATAGSRVAYGIDVSVWNGSVDWAKVKASGVEYAILRIGFEYTLDTRFLEYVQGCVDNDIPYGVYIYSYAESESEALGEANFVLNTLKTYNLKPDLPIWFDFEDECQVTLSNSTMNTIVKAFCNTIRDAGYDVGLYTYIWLLNGAFATSYYDSIPIWIAQPDTGSTTATYNGGTWQWQYSWVGSISGMSGDVDCNYYYGPVPGHTSDTSYLTKCTYYPSNMDVTVSTAVNLRQYPSTDYSSLQSLSVGTELHVTGMYKNAYGNYWYQVEKDGTTGYVDANYVTINNYRYDDLAVIDPTMASNINLGAGYSLAGRVVSKYNALGTVKANIYSGEDLLGTPVLTSSDTTDDKEYNLKSSNVCNNLIFSDLAADYYTYEISADVVNYYASNGSLKSVTENVVLWTAPFTVGSAPIEPPASVACDHNIVTDAAVAAGCTTTGLTEGSHCSKCGVVFKEQTVVAATGHSYGVSIAAGTCQAYPTYTFTCSGCGDSYSMSEDALTSTWIEEIPSGMDASLFNTKTQYRYADCTSKVVDTASGVQGSVTYIKSWPTGFNTSHSTYSQYNKSSSKVTASETDTTKTVINSDERVGYLWYHWCDTTVTSSWAYETDPYHTFHVYYNTDSPDDYACDTSDYSYKTSHSTCSNTAWWFPIEVYTQTYTTYNKVCDGVEWSAWSDWSDTAYTAVANTRKVETRTVYQLKEANLGDHQFVAGTCRLCGEADPNVQLDYYLFGYIDNSNYGCEEDFTTLGEYKFDENGMLTTTFMHDSYVAVKASDNYNFYMTDGWLGYDCTSAILYHTGDVASPDKLYVPGGVKVTFTLVDNGDGTFTLSYEAEERVLPPVLTPKYPTMSIEDEILVNVYFEIENLGDISLDDIGILTWDTAPSNGTIDNAENVFPGATYNNSTNYYCVQTGGIAAKKISDTFYFRLYAKMTNGTYVYSNLLPYSPKTFANNQLNSSSSAESLKTLMVAMLNYGAAAQTYFSYKPYNLMNASLTDDQKAMVDAYSSSMVQSVSAAPSAKQGAFIANGGFSSKRPSVSLEGAFAINYYFTPSNTVKGNVTFYYWTQETFEKLTTLTTVNASGIMTMTNENGVYSASISGIAAKEIDRAIYVAGVYTATDGTIYSTGVLPYSLGVYCASQAASGTAAMQPMAAATAVYGYYAKLHFSN